MLPVWQLRIWRWILDFRKNLWTLGVAVSVTSAWDMAMILGLLYNTVSKTGPVLACRCNGDARDPNLLVHKKDIMSISSPVI